MPATPELFDVHEERIQGLEVSVENLTELVKDGFKETREHLSKVGEHLTEGARRFEVHETRLNALQAAEDRRAARASIVKKAAITLVLTGAGVLASEIGKLIWSMIHG